MKKLGRRVGMMALVGLLLLTIVGVSAEARIEVLHGGTDPRGWYVIFNADEAGYRGKVLHLHIYALSPAEEEIIAWSLRAAAAVGLLGGPAGWIVSAVALILDVSKELSKNADGSYDFYVFKGEREGLFGIWTPFWFSGFVSDVGWKPAVTVPLLKAGPPGIANVWAKEVGSHYRHLPKPLQIHRTCDKTREYPIYNRCWGWHRTHTYDLGRTYFITEVTAKVAAGPTEAKRRVGPFYIELSRDGVNWQRLSPDFLAPAGLGTTTQVTRRANIRARYVRIYTHGYYVDWSEIFIDAFGER